MGFRAGALEASSGFPQKLVHDRSRIYDILAVNFPVMRSQCELLGVKAAT